MDLVASDERRSTTPNSGPCSVSARAGLGLAWIRELTVSNGTVFGFMLLNICGGVGAGMLGLLIPLYAIDLGAGMGEIGLIRSLQGIGMFVSTMPAGFLIDRYGSRRVYVIGALVGSVLVSLLPAVPTAKLLLILVALRGTVGPLTFTSVNAAFFRRLSRIGVGKAGWHKGSMSVGLSVLGPMLGAVTR
ncbi:MAG: MFS transporter [Chloroflexota bacterium]|nr:MAG: MFS transporter [Chloroflexota bacterium]